MSTSESLADAFVALTRAADHRDIDIGAQLREFTKAAELAVASYLGMTLVIDSHEVSVTVLDSAAAEIATSLKVPLTRFDGSGRIGTLTLYAAAPGAFVDLAADLTYALDTPYGVPVLDHDLPPNAEADVSNLGQRTTIDRAIGALIQRGHTLDSAKRELERLSALGTGDPNITAETVLQTPRQPPEQRL